MVNDEIKRKNSSIVHKDNSLKRLDLSFLKHINLKEFKKSDLLAYWINDFSEYHDEERNFDISKSGVFSRGDIIKVNLGFNIGNELGGLHYCVVLSKYDNTRNGTLVVVPLTSKKENKKYDSSNVNIGNELYEVLNNRLIKEKTKLQEMNKQLNNMNLSTLEIKNKIKKEKLYINKMEKELSKMKQDNIVLINQITTISKQRIFKDLLRKNVKLSNKSLDLIDQKIIKYFTK